GVSGMTTPHRSRLLGDLDENAPDGWLWGGPGGRSVDALLLLYAAEESRLQALYAVHAAALASAGLALVEKLQTAPLDRKEPFGFSDGISQPNVEGLPRNGTAENTIKIGEMVLGYQNEYGLYTDRPLVSRQDDPGGILPADAIGSGKADLGRNGTYLVLRHLEQDVVGFWKHLDVAARGDSDEGVRLAAKIVGRWPSGASLVLSPDHDDERLGDAKDLGYGSYESDWFSC